MKNTALLAAASLLALTPSVAQAQASDALDPGAAGTTQAPEELPGTIIVSGEKIDRTLQDTVTSVSVTTAEQIAVRNIQTLQEVYNRTANVSETYGSYGFTIRGMDNRGVSGGGDAALATVYVDGAPIPSTALHGAPTDTWDVEQVEIFRGPQSTLQGLNSLAGAVHVRTRDPQFYWGGRAQARATLEEEFQVSAAGGGPLVEDELAFRVSADFRDERGLIYNPTRDEYSDALEAVNLRGKLRWTPEALPGFDAVLSYTHYDRDGAYYYSYSDLSVDDIYDDRRNFSDTENTGKTNVDIATAELSYEISPQLTLTSITSYNDVVEDNQFDADFSPATDGFGSQDRAFETLTEELRLTYEGERLNGVFGLFYYDRDQVLQTDSRSLVPVPTATAEALLVSGLVGMGFPQAQAEALAPTIVSAYTAQLPVIPVDYVSYAPNSVETYAVFADANFALTDRVNVIAGFRYDHEDSRIAVEQDGIFAGTYPTSTDPLFAQAFLALNAGIEGLISSASGSLPETDESFDAFLPKLGVELSWSDDLTTAFVVQRGYRSGGTSFNVQTSTPYSYDPEYTWNYELSLRARPAPGVQILANAFYVDWSDQQVTVQGPSGIYDTFTANAGESHVYGFELEAQHHVNASFDWYASVGHVQTEFDEFTVDPNEGAVTDLSDTEFAYAPDWTLAAGANFRSGNFVGNINASYRSSVYSTTGVNQVQQRLDERTVVNARIGYDFGDAMLYVFANNLLDEDYIQYLNPVYNVAVVGDPRIVGIGLEVGF
ncbi:hypothetical protein B5C34_12380 [Pacificimonas flava]|uniref:TonB-dependent receptor n=2 Tax=Pacificimonas TaxID=1960290 RepID=A0A219B735_9SPHN|nr:MULTISPECIES: TonB-dependent receptor [Pacificimonas]MBZ6378537.1 TonB-dependent receptor [Pacificimonas aurantium]OWV34177.1 hypothetical protein B5C34_12380 [Pacificimonas flava]